jgi:hypothetical protein
MIKAKDAVIWVNNDTHEVVVWQRGNGRPHDLPERRTEHWVDPIGAAYVEWRDATNDQRMRLMTETAIDLAVQGFALKDLLVAFSQVVESRALGSQSIPMCRALTSALVGQCLEPNTMSFEELLENYGPRAG